MRTFPLIRLFMHEFTASVQSVTWLSVLLRIRTRLGFFIFFFVFFFLFRAATLLEPQQRIPYLCIEHDTRLDFPLSFLFISEFQILTASHCLSLCEVRNAHAQSVAREIYRQLGRDVSGRLSSIHCCLVQKLTKDGVK